MRPDFLRKPRSLEEEEKRRLVAAALHGMVTADDMAETTVRGKLLSFPGNSSRFDRMIGLLEDTRNPNRADRCVTFLKYWRELAAEMGAARHARKEAMGAEGRWDFPDLMRNDLDFVRILAGLRWMAFRYRVGLALDSRALSTLVHQALAFADVT